MKEEKFSFSGEPQRLDIFLKEKYRHLSREVIKKIINQGFVLVNNNRVKPSLKIKNNDFIEIRIPQQKTNQELEEIITYQDDSVIIINKPTGLLIHPTDFNWLKDYEILKISEETLALKLYLKYQKEKINPPPRLGIVHRLDRDTSGIMVIAKNENAFDRLISQFKERKVEKTYLGIVYGEIREKKLSIDAPIGRESGQKKMKVWEYGRNALTDIKIIKSNEKYSYLEIKPKTGRTNQIRVHLSFIGHPIVGDKIYSKSNFERLMLHAYKLKFIHPDKLKTMEFKAEPDIKFKKIIKDFF